MRLTHGLFIGATAVSLINCSQISAQDQNHPPLRLSLTQTSGQRNANSSLPMNWTEYIGLEGAARNWAGTVRIPGRAEIAESPQAVSEMMAKLKPFLAQKQGLIISVGGLVSARSPEQVRNYLNQIQQDRGKAWKARVYRQASTIAKNVTNPNQYALQIGNEINSRHYTEAISLWRGEAPQTNYRQNDTSLISIYVEYYLAPTVEAIRKASQDVYRTDNRIKIVLGSLANANNENSQEWVQALLSYTVKGQYAPTLSGQTVSQLVNVISTHYLVSADDLDWRSKLNNLWSRWVGRGRITGIWATEELGKQRALKGRGAETALKVTARYLDWWGSRRLRPEQAKLSFWGWELGPADTQGEVGMQSLYKCLGAAPLRSRPLKPQTPSAATDLETYFLETTTAPTKRALLIFPTVNLEKLGRNSRKQSQKQQHEAEDGDSLTITLPKTIAIADSGWTTNLKTTLQFFSSAGVVSSAVKTTHQNGEYQLALPQDLNLHQQNVALFCLTQIP